MEVQDYFCAETVGLQLRAHLISLSLFLLDTHSTSPSGCLNNALVLDLQARLTPASASAELPEPTDH